MLVPPKITAAIAWSSIPNPACDVPSEILETWIAAAIPAAKPQNEKAKIFTKFTLMPDNIEASSFPPIAKIYLPIVVLVKIKVDIIAKTISI